jgi:hypothetical protein
MRKYQLIESGSAWFAAGCNKVQGGYWGYLFV